MPNNYPIVLAHGIARFDFLLANFLGNLKPLSPVVASLADGLHYFKGIANHLRRNGFVVHHSSVNFAGSLVQRSQDLRDEINRIIATPNSPEKVHIISHSMGGLDSRRMIVEENMAEKVASLTTIGTPHLGTFFADWGMANQGHEIIKKLEPVIDIHGFADLTTDACTAFNQTVRNAEATNKVVYQTYSSHEEQTRVFNPLKLSWKIISDEQGANDGLVPVSSQQWNNQLVADDGTVKQIQQRAFPVGADHLNEVGWWDISQFPLGSILLFHLPEAIVDYELGIKNVYLQIAKDVSMLEL